MIAADNADAVEAIIGRKKLPDIDHVYASWQNGCDYFVTEDVTDFIRGGRREALQEAMPGLRIRTTDELLQELGAQP